jgi:Zn-dependent peptidase ImmA (M78 family)
MKSIYSIPLTCILVLILTNCTKQFDNEIEYELQIHFDTFVEEAAAYDLNISIEQVDIGAYVTNIEQRGTLGQCKSYSDGSKQIIIDQPFWDKASDIEREYVVFHELGHCLLGRDHKDEKDASGNCASIMQSGEGGCDGIYNIQNRNSLLNELFDF